MTIFADTLRQFLDRKRATIYTIAKVSGIDRTKIQHMKTGKRAPANLDEVLAIARAMMLGPGETDELVSAWHISNTGEDLYHRREQVRRIISSFYDTNAASKLAFHVGSHTTLSVPEPMKTIVGQNNVNLILRAVLETEAAKESGRISIIAQPEYAYLFNCLASMDLNSRKTQVEMILVFDKNEDARGMSYNLDILRQLIPLFFQCENFRASYVYGDVSSLFSSISFMPFKVITSDYALFVSYEQDKAVLYTDADMRKFTEESFQRQLSVASPICHSFHPTPAEYVASTFNSPEEFAAGDWHELLYQPCIPCFCPEDILLDRLNMEIIPTELLPLIREYMGKVRDRFSRCLNAFTMEGLRLFMDTGRVTEIPDFMYTYLTPAQRLVLLKHMIDAADAGNFHPSVIRSEKFTVPSPLCIVAPSEQSVVIYYFSPDKGQYTFRLQELSLVQAFYDFLVFLQESPFVYDAATSRRMLHEVYDEYSAKFAETK